MDALILVLGIIWFIATIIFYAIMDDKIVFVFSVIMFILTAVVGGVKW